MKKSGILIILILLLTMMWVLVIYGVNLFIDGKLKEGIGVIVFCIIPYLFLGPISKRFFE